MPITPALWEAEVGKLLKAGTRRLTWPAWQNRISTEITKISQAW